MNLVNKIKWILAGRPCLHLNCDVIHWVAYITYRGNREGTPMTRKVCIDCGEVLDEGHVHGDTDDWEKVWMMRDGGNWSARPLTPNDLLFL